MDSPFFADGLDYLCSLVGAIPLNAVRVGLYRHVFKIRIGRHSRFQHGCRFLRPSGVVIGDNSLIGRRSFLDGRSGLVIGNNVNIAGETAIFTLQHDPESPAFAAAGGRSSSEIMISPVHGR